MSDPTREVLSGSKECRLAHASTLDAREFWRMSRSLATALRTRSGRTAALNFSTLWLAGRAQLTHTVFRRRDDSAFARAWRVSARSSCSVAATVHVLRSTAPSSAFTAAAYNA